MRNALTMVACLSFGIATGFVLDGITGLIVAFIGGAIIGNYGFRFGENK